MVHPFFLARPQQGRVAGLLIQHLLLQQGVKGQRSAVTERTVRLRACEAGF